MAIKDFVLPAGVKFPEPVHTLDTPPKESSGEAKARLLPKPSGYRLLCAVPDVAETFENSGIIKADAHIRSEEIATTILFVLDMGPDAYGDKAKFPNGPWCKRGDFVLVRTYAGTRFKIYNKEFRLINDDQVEAVVDDPRGVSRAY